MLDRPSLRRVLEDLLRAEIAAAGRRDAVLPPGPWPDELPIGHAGLGADSLERLTLAAAVNEMFHVHESGTEDLLLARRNFGDWVDLVCRSRGSHNERISFRTSGSTGQPKRCTHDLAALWSEAAEHAKRLRPTRILLAVPAHHIYGFIFGILIPLHANCPLIDIRARLPPSFQPGDVIVSFPDHWRFLARSLDRLPVVTGVTSTSPMPADLAHGMLSCGLTRLVQVYGSSETAGVAWRDDPDGPFTLLDNWSADQTTAQEHVLSLAGRDGRVAITQDIVAMAGPRQFHIRRRADDAIQIGGINVFPSHVAAVLQAHPKVAHARVRLSASGEGGRLKALIVPRNPEGDTDFVRKELVAWIESHLQPAEQPRSVTVRTQLPQGPLGKDCDWSELP